MISLNLDKGPLKVLCLGSHSDDIEIGCGGTILRLLEHYPDCTLHWAVFSAAGIREAEARRGAELFGGSHLTHPIFKAFRDGFMPYTGAEVKAIFENELKQLSPHLI